MGLGEEQQRVPEQHCTADQGQAKGWQAGPPFGKGTLVLRLNRKRQSGQDKGTAL